MSKPDKVSVLDSAAISKDILRVKVGVGVMTLRDGQVLLARRKNAHGEGEYAFTGGHMEFGESFEDTALRETTEEAGIEIHNLKFLCLNNFKTYQGTHYVDVGLLAEWKSGEPQNLEPHKREDWGWYDLDNLPSPLFEPCKYYFQAYRNGTTYFDS